VSEKTTLADRIDAEFVAAKEKMRQLQREHVDEYQKRQQRLEKLEAVLEEHRDVWRPKLETLAGCFADRIKVTPHIVPGKRQATFEVESELAHVLLRFSVTSDADVRQVVFLYDLEILPIFMKFDSHSELQLPLESIDRPTLEKWIDDRIMSFVRTYMSLYENEHYLRDHMVADPIAKVRFPKFAAATKLEVKGKTIYFITEETRRQYEQQQTDK
jgi:YHS domain-containing protein/FtsZ-binding cell division protein ZapB